MWFLVVVMTMTSDVTPLWVFSKTTFETRETCIEFAMENKDPLFAEAIKAHNTFYDDKPDEGMNDPNFKEVGEELEGLVYTKLLKNRPKMYANYTHAILCGNGGGRSSTFDWFFKHKISYRPYHCSDSKWLSKKSVKIEYAVENVNSSTEKTNNT